MTLTPEEIERYRRHILLPEIGGQGQQRLKESNILVVGAGGLGCAILSYLVAAGAGKISLIDPDLVERSNLQRQILYRDADIGRAKVIAAAEVLQEMNHNVQISINQNCFDIENSLSLVDGCDLVVEGVDRIDTRQIINRSCHKAGVPLLTSALGRFDGQVALFPMDSGSSCYRCMVPDMSDEELGCETQGVLGAVPGVIGSLAALEALKFLLKMKGALSNEVLIYDGLSSRLRRTQIPRDPACKICAI